MALYHADVPHYLLKWWASLIFLDRVKWWLDYIFNKVPLQMENCITNWSHTKCKIHWKGNLNTAYVYTLYFNQNLKLDDWHSLCIAPIKALVSCTRRYSAIDWYVGFW